MENFAQGFLNGSFEDTQLGCRIGLSNAGLTSHVRNVIAFGVIEEINLLTSDCGQGQAQNGNYFIGFEDKRELPRTG